MFRRRPDARPARAAMGRAHRELPWGAVNTDRRASPPDFSDGLAAPAQPQRPVRGDVWLGVAACLVGLALALAAVPAFVRAPTEPRPLAMAPWFLPSVAAWMMVASGAALTIAALRRPRDRGGEGGGEPLGLLRAALALVAYVALMPLLGAMTTGLLVTTALAATSEGVSWRRALGVGVAVPLLAWALFTQLAGTPLPRGPWGLL